MYSGTSILLLLILLPTAKRWGGRNLPSEAAAQPAAKNQETQEI
jgi:hypothetical protein